MLEGCPAGVRASSAFPAQLSAVCGLQPWLHRGCLLLGASSSHICLLTFSLTLGCRDLQGSGMLEQTENRGLAGVDSLCTSPELSLGAALGPVMWILGPSLLLESNPVPWVHS